MGWCGQALQRQLGPVRRGCWRKLNGLRGSVSRRDTSFGKANRGDQRNLRPCRHPPSRHDTGTAAPSATGCHSPSRGPRFAFMESRVTGRSKGYQGEGERHRIPFNRSLTTPVCEKECGSLPPAITAQGIDQQHNDLVCVDGRLQRMMFSFRARPRVTNAVDLTLQSPFPRGAGMLDRVCRVAFSMEAANRGRRISARGRPIRGR